MYYHLDVTCVKLEEVVQRLNRLYDRVELYNEKIQAKNDAVKAYDDCVSTTQYDASTAKAIFDYYKTRSGLASESVETAKKNKEKIAKTVKEKTAAANVVTRREKMTIENFKNIPDRISCEECRMLFETIINMYDDNSINKIELFDCLLEVVDRQVMTYEILDYNTKDRIDNLMAKMWNTFNYDDVDVIMSITVNLGLTKTFEMIKKSFENDSIEDKKIYSEIDEFLNENEGDISNPYRFL